MGHFQFCCLVKVQRKNPMPKGRMWVTQEPTYSWAFCFNTCKLPLFFFNPLQIPKDGAKLDKRETHGSVSEWLMETDCKSVGLRLRWFKSSPAHHF